MNLFGENGIGTFLKAVKRPTTLLLTLLFLGVFWLGFTTIRYSIAQPLCCADDAAISLVAKSLSKGTGYALPINFSGESGRFPFDPGISTGATLIIPAAIMLRIFGDHPWVPGFTSAIISLGLLLWIFGLALRRFGPRDGAAYSLLTLLLVYFVTSGPNFIHWHALVGEVPSALLTVCAVFYVVGDGSKISSRFLSGILLGLAVQAKLLASLAFPAFALLSLWGATGVARKRSDWLSLAALSAGFFTPIFAFELWKLFELGAHGYVAWFGQLRAFMQSQVPGANLGGDRISALFERAFSNSKSSLNVYGHAPVDLAAYVFLLSIVSWKFCDRTAGKFALCVMLVAVTHLMWWAFFSNGWQRYELIGVILTSCVLATVGLWKIELPIKVVAIAVSLALALPLSKPQQLTWFLRSPSSLESLREKNLREAIQPIMHGQHSSVLIGGWWASLVEAKFMLPDNIRVAGFNRVDSLKEKDADVYLMVNHKWDGFAGLDKDPAYKSFEDKCSSLLVKNDDFELYKCAK